MTAADLLARLDEKVQCGLPGCTTLLPVKVRCTPRHLDQQYDVIVTADPEALRRHLRDAHRPATPPPPTSPPTLRRVR